MVEIEEVLKRYDCGAFVSLHSKEHGEFKMIVEHMSWSNVRFLRKGEVAHVKLYMKLAKANTTSTVAMLASMRDLAAVMFNNADIMMKQLEVQAKITHIPVHKRITNDDREDGGESA